MIGTYAIALIVLALALAADAHIKVFYQPFQYPVRNAPGATSDGLFSAAAAQPCGGTNQWGRDNQRRYALVVDGQKVCTRVNWNGGHRTTENENKLRAVFRCNRPTIPQDFLNLPPLQFAEGTDPAPEANGYLVNAKITNERWDGYTLCVNLPVQNIQPGQEANENDQARQCTLSIMEGNSWGGCLDMLLYANAANGGTMEPYMAPPQLTPVQYNQLISQPIKLNGSEGTYRIANCFTDTGGRCCLTGYFGVLNNGAVSARFYGNNGYDTCFELSWGYRDYQMILRPSKFSPSQYEANFYLYMGYDNFGRPVTTQNMSLTIREGGNMMISNVGLDIPEVSDHDVLYFSSLNDGYLLGYIPYPAFQESSDNLPWNYIIGGIVGGVILIYLVGGVIWSRCRGGPCHHPHIHAVLVGLGCVRRRRKKNLVTTQDDDGLDKPVQGTPVTATSSKPKSGFSLQLPPNWSSAVDPMSGEVYYFNTQTKETKWDRPSW